MNRISSTSAGATSAVGGAGQGNPPSSGALAGAVLGGLAGKMAGNIGAALNLAGNGGTDAWQGNGNDPYAISEIAEELSGQLGGSPSEVGDLSRALHAFVQESASLFAARPESRSLARLNDVINHISGGADQANMGSLIGKVDSATALLQKQG